MQDHLWRVRLKSLCWIVVGVVGIFLSGCAVKVASAPVGGSRADGTVTLAYEYGMFQTPEVNWAEMQKQAQDRCLRWGYLTADRFGGELRNCVQQGSSGCLRWRVSIEYQCQTLKPPS